MSQAACLRRPGFNGCISYKSFIFLNGSHKVLILGGGVAGVIAARTLHRNGIDDFVIVEARHELGGRMMSHSFGGKTIELGANWIQGTQTGTGPANPIFELAKKHNIKSQSNDFGSVST
jgi:polyamine oxidase